MSPADEPAAPGLPEQGHADHAASTYPSGPQFEAPAWLDEPVGLPADEVRAADTPPPGPSPLRAVIIAALVGALVSGGLVALIRDRDRPSGRPIVFNGNTSKVARAGDIQEILSKVEPAVVAVNTQAATLDFFLQPVPQQGAGTGFVVDPDGVIVTNNHVIAGAQNIKVTFADGNRTLDARVLGRDPSADLAVLKVDATGLNAVTLGDSDKLEVGDDVIAIGNALALPGGPTVTRGIISAKNRTIQAGGNGEPIERLEGVLQTDAAINPGNSGGPLVNAAGEVIAINTAIAGEGQNIGFAIAITQARSIIDQLRQGKTPTQPFLGVQTATLSQSQKAQLGVNDGAIVVEVTPGSGAENAGMERGDVIVEMDGKKVSTADDVGKVVRGHKPGDRIDIVVLRNGNNRVTLQARIGQRVGSGG
jgi:S1-C subfamily serine protease